MYPPPAALVACTNLDPDKSAASATCCAISKGFTPTDLESSKQAEDDNSPNSGLGGDSNASETANSGHTFLNVSLRTDSQLLRNSANGLTAVIRHSHSCEIASHTNH